MTTIATMPLYLALLLSLVLHAALIVAPAWRTGGQPPAATANLQARLTPPSPATAMAEAVSTEDADSGSEIRPRPAAVPRRLEGSSLRRAQAALTEHLFYPPQAVARGLEGDVILLLTLGDGGQLVSAAIARSSGHALLDQAALDAAQRIGALPGNPRQTLFPVSFRLR
jgi:protein TonB